MKTVGKRADPIKKTFFGRMRQLIIMILNSAGSKPSWSIFTEADDRWKKYSRCQVDEIGKASSMLWIIACAKSDVSKMW